MIFLANLFRDYNLSAWGSTRGDQFVRHLLAVADYEKAHAAFHKWQIARPKLWVSQDEYATNLVLEMIDACVRAAQHAFFEEGRKFCDENIAALCTLLDTPPPGASPPDTRARRDLGSIFIISPPVRGASVFFK